MILIATIWVGEAVLHFFGVEIPSLQVAGGVMIASIALSMLHSKQSAIHDTSPDDASANSAQDIAVVPLAMPMIAGPGAMVTVIVNTHQYSGITANLMAAKRPTTPFLPPRDSSFLSIAADRLYRSVQPFR